tara:strand:- start:143 stop:1408 length:1266 start_codon:yes stop_codon:yes gene_type:complete
MESSKVGECKVIKINHEDFLIFFLMEKEEGIKKILEQFSSFVNKQNISDIKKLGKGSFGSVFSFSLDGVEYAVKEQAISKSHFLEQKEKEVSIANYLKDLRRIDGQRICVPIFDCFFLCLNDETILKDKCVGRMYYVMEKGMGDIVSLLVKKDGIVSNHQVKVVLVRSAMVKMMENIQIMVSQGNIVNWDIKPGNTVFNFKKMIDTGIVDINPMFIDFDDKFSEYNLSNLVNIELLQKILDSYIDDNIKKPIKKKLNMDDIKSIFTLILQISYLYHSIDLISYLKSKMTEKEVYELISYSFFKEQQPGEVISLINIFSNIINPNEENIWLKIAFELILKTNIIDSSKTYLLKRTFYHYNMPRFQGDVDGKYTQFIDKLQEIYIYAMKFLKNNDTPNNFFIDLDKIESIIIEDNFNIGSFSI